MKPTEWVAIYAAIVSTVALLWNISASRSVVRVSITAGITESDFGYYIGLANPSGHTVHINSVALVHNYRPVTLWERIAFVLRFRRNPRFCGWVHTSAPLNGLKTGVPVSIEARSSHMFFIPEAALREAVRSEPRSTGKIAARAQDALWRNRYSNIVTIRTAQRVIEA